MRANRNASRHDRSRHGHRHCPGNDNDITYLRVCDPEPERVVAILRRKAETMTTAAEAFLNYSRDKMMSVHRSP